MLDLTPIASTSVTDQVEQKIIDYLKDKQLRPGDPLPKEQEFATALGVSRNVVREALSRFRMLGMIESKKRRGIILTQPDILGSFERVLNPLMLDSKTLKDIFELRLILELGLSDLIFKNLKSRDIKDLEMIVNDSNLAVNKELAEITFHSKLYQMTNNNTYLRFQKMLLPIFKFVIDYESTNKERVEVGNVNHKDLIDLVKDGDAEKFRSGMREHLRPHFNRLGNW
jgi:GntR family transcriptional repressor for pyruvate dehydrogenase complex